MARIIRSRQVTLRQPTTQDEATFLAAVRRSRKLYGRYANPPSTTERFHAALLRLQDPSHESFLVVDAATDDLVGVINLNEIVRGPFQGAYLGYYGFEPFVGQGLMRAGLALVIDQAFGKLRLHRLEANIQPDNEPSLALVRRLGFQREGYSPRYLKLAGRWRDHERWALLREEWRGRKRE
ncbi:MAG: phosphinothricin acetyltransferase [Pirellula sp.]|nr:phosphinothricin acetyltransferase [Pirellula sp.]